MVAVAVPGWLLPVRVPAACVPTARAAERVLLARVLAARAAAVRRSPLWPETIVVA
jgi:hypothetical protein